MCQSSDELTINAPNLKAFYLSDHYLEFCLYAPLLAKLLVELMEIEITPDEEFIPENQSSVCNYANFFHGITNLVELSGHDYFTQLSVDCKVHIAGSYTFMPHKNCYQVYADQDDTERDLEKADMEEEPCTDVSKDQLTE